MHGLSEIGGSVWPRVPLALRDVKQVHSKETQGQTEPSKGEAIFLERAIELFKSVDFDKAEVRRENRTVFLCGGFLNQAAVKPPTVREALLRHLPSRDRFADSLIILAERATEALPGSNFTNLLDLEEYISALVDGVILIVESAGSICELGAFVKTSEIREKLIVVISSAHDNSPSFIKLGALKYFEEISDGEPEISPFHWEVQDDGVNIQDYVLDDIVSEISESLSRVKPRGKFKIDNLGDRIHLTLSICHVLRGAKLAEIKSIYSSIGFGSFENEIVKHLSVLEIVGHVVPVTHGRKIKYYIPKTDKSATSTRFWGKAKQLRTSLQSETERGFWLSRASRMLATVRRSKSYAARG